MRIELVLHAVIVLVLLIVWWPLAIGYTLGGLYMLVKFESNKGDTSGPNSWKLPSDKDVF